MIKKLTDINARKTIKTVATDNQILRQNDWSPNNIPLVNAWINILDMKFQISNFQCQMEFR